MVCVTDIELIESIKGVNGARRAIEALSLLYAPQVKEPTCHDCGREYGEPGFPDLVIPHDVWNSISPAGNEGGLLCPSCLCERLEKAGIKTTGKFTSGPLRVLTGEDE